MLKRLYLKILKCKQLSLLWHRYEDSGIQNNQVDMNTARDFAFSHGAIDYFETSAKSGENGFALFQKIAENGTMNLSKEQVNSIVPPEPTPNTNSFIFISFLILLQQKDIIKKKVNVS